MASGRPDAETFTGWNEVSAAITAGVSAPWLVWFVWIFASRAGPAVGLAIAVVGLAVVAAASLTDRYRVVVDDDGIEVSWRRFGFWTTRRQRFLLDASVALYESFESDAPEAVCIEPAWVAGNEDPRAEAFADSFRLRRMEDVRDRIRAAVERARRRVERPQETVDIAGIPPDALDLEPAQRGPSGRITRVPTSAPFVLQGVTVAGGSVLHLHPEDRWIDPRRADVLRAVEVAAPTWVAALRRDVRAGARLAGFHGAGPTSVRDAFDGEVEIGGVWVDGVLPLGFRASGRLTSFTLARPYTLGARTWPARSQFWQMPGEPGWRVTLGGPVSLGDVTLDDGDSVTLDDSGCPVSFRPRRSGTMTIGGVTVRLGYGSIPLTSDGTVDVARCRELRLLA